MTNRILAPCSLEGRRFYVTVKIENGRLSITSVHGPKANGDCYGGCGQHDTPLINPESKPEQGWTREQMERLHALWKRWHLNNMRPGCEHQRAEKWSERPIDPSKPTNTYGLHFEGQKHPSWNMLTWVRRSEHPEGLMCEPCPECGYKYGTAWLREELPDEVIEELHSFPEFPGELPGGWGR